MPRIKPKPPSPGLTVAFIALLVALSGTALALPGRGRVDSGDIRNGAVKSGDIGNSEIRSRDIRNSGVFTQDIRNETIRSRDIFQNAVTGGDINESTLAAVPTAVNATNAAKAADADKLGGATAAAIAGETQPFSFSLTNGQNRQIATSGPLTLSATCAINSGGNDVGTINLATSTDNAAVDAAGGSEDEDLDVAEGAFAVGSHNVATGGVEIEQFNGAVARAADGSSLLLAGYGIGFNLSGSSGTCTFLGSVVVTGTT